MSRSAGCQQEHGCHCLCSPKPELLQLAGVSAQSQLDVNSLAVPRAAGEAIGGIARMTHRDGRAMTINVEYNQLGPLLQANGWPEGDVADESGHSPFPGMPLTPNPSLQSPTS